MREEVVIGMMVWLLVLTLFYVMLLICVIIQRLRHRKKKKLYLKYAESMRAPAVATPDPQIHHLMPESSDQRIDSHTDVFDKPQYGRC